MVAMQRFNMRHNSLRDPIPDAVGSLTAMRQFDLQQNSFHGPIPDAVGSMTLFWGEFSLSANSLRGPIPHAVGFMAVQSFHVDHNRLCGPIAPVVGSLLELTSFMVSANSLRGSIPDAVGSMLKMHSFDVRHNSLTGPIPHAVGSWTSLHICSLGDNNLRGPIPQAFEAKPKMGWFHVEQNSLSGTIPVALTILGEAPIFSAYDNQMSGSIPSSIVRSHRKYLKVLLHANHLTGTVPVFKDVMVLTASGNMLEGRLPGTISSELAILDVSGVPVSSGGVNGPLPWALRQASELKVLTMANQQIDGGIPSFTSSLSILALYKNRLKVLPDIRFENDSLKTAILLHDNVLSCSVPMCDNVAARASLIAIGNRLQYPKGEFPAWVHKYEHDPLFWVSGTDGTSLVLKISAAVGLFMFAVLSKLGSARLLRVLSGWQTGPATHLWIVKATALVHACLLMASLLAAVSFMFLLSWDLYACPQTLVLASACSRSSALIRTLVFLCWCKLSVHSPAVEHLTTKGEKLSKWTAKILIKRLLLWLLWCGLTVVLSIVVILYQMGKSIPGSLQVGKILSLGLMVCAGATQGLIVNIVVPYLGSKMTLQKHVCTTVSSLLMSCVIPGVVIIYLDTDCLGGWVALWKQCQRNSQKFQYRLTCTSENQCIKHWNLLPGIRMDITIVRPSDICDPHFSWSPASISRFIDFLRGRFRGRSPKGRQLHFASPSSPDLSPCIKKRITFGGKPWTRRKKTLKKQGNPRMNCESGGLARNGK